MSWLQVIVLAIIQGITEFLPISSSGHLIIPSLISDWPDQGLTFDVAVHLGTLLAILTYFRKDIIQMSQHWLRHGFSKQQSAQSKLAWLVILATIPALLVGYLCKDFIAGNLRSAFVIATTNLIFACVLALADKFYQKRVANGLGGLAELSQMKWSSALFIGLAQALALIPGTSRSGVTMSAALFAGFDRVQAARFSFLLSIPVTTSAIMLYSFKLATTDVQVIWSHLIVAIALTTITAFFCIHFFLAWIGRMGFMPFVWYRLALALLLYAFVFF